jgi:hypothetical protein
MLQPHLYKVHFQLFGDQHRDRGVGALAHLDIGHGQDNLPIAANANEGVGREAVAAGRFGIAVCERQVQAQHQASAGGRPGLKESTPREIVRGRRSIRACDAGREVIGDHGQPPCPLGCAACLIASRMRT